MILEGRTSMRDLPPVGRVRGAPETALGLDIDLGVKLQRLEILDVSVHRSDSSAKRMQLRNTFVRAAGSIIEVTGIGFQGLPENDGVRLEGRRFVGIGRDAAKPTDRPIHQIARHLLSP